MVKGSPVVNDVTRVDAKSTGMSDLVQAVDNGSDMPGTVSDRCSPYFQSRFQTTDLVIAKGQGNYESLNEIEKSVFFLFKAKCSVIAQHLGCEIDKLILIAPEFQRTFLNNSDRNPDGSKNQCEADRCAFCRDEPAEFAGAYTRRSS